MKFAATNAEDLNRARRTEMTRERQIRTPMTGDGTLANHKLLIFDQKLSEVDAAVFALALIIICQAIPSYTVRTPFCEL